MTMWGRFAEPKNAPYVADYNADYNALLVGKVNPAFAVPDPDPTNGGYVAPFGWTSRFSREDNLPDRMRLGTEEVLQAPTVDQDSWYARNRNANYVTRRSDADVHVSDTFYPVQHGPSGKQVTDSPYRPGWPDPKRITIGVNPNSWNFTRKFDQTPARHLTGEHFSMAGHRRNYDTFGMRPVSMARNTYRLDPTPWDAAMYDSPANTPEYEVGTASRESAPAADYGTRSYRL